MSDLNLTFRKCPESRKFTKEEEKKYFPKPGESVLCLLNNGEYAVLEFDFYYCSFKESESREMIRDGNGETTWNYSKSDIVLTNTTNGNDVIGWYKLQN